MESGCGGGSFMKDRPFVLYGRTSIKPLRFPFKGVAGRKAGTEARCGVCRTQISHGQQQQRGACKMGLTFGGQRR